MHSNTFKATMKTAIFVVAILLLATRWTLAQVTVNLTAQPTSITMPDGQSVPMWGYLCGNTSSACTNLNAPANGWSPVMITVPTGQDLTINLTNNLSFSTSGSPNNVPTSLVIVGQLGGGLGTTAKLTPGPAHGAQGTTWPIANTGPVNNPPQQGPRVQSFSTEVATGATTALTWSNLRPGTYLLESGTHPSIQATMGLYGIVVVTAAPSGSTAGTAYPGVTYGADVPLLFGEIDPSQNRAVATAVTTSGFKESSTWSSVPPGPLSSITVTNPGHSYPSTAVVTITGGGGSGATATASVDPATGAVTSITLVTAGTGYTSAPTIAISGAPGVGAAATAEVTSTGTASVCSDGASACYPPVVNYTPLYYLINGRAFDKTNAGASLFNTSPASGVTGSVMVRMVNAGSRMHVPALVGTVTGAKPGFSLIAEDGNPLPGVPRIQNEVFMAAGKTYDVKIDVPAAGSNAVAVFDRELSLSAASTNRDSGMVGYISVNGAALPGAAGFGGAHAVADVYNAVIAGQTLTVADVSKGVVANDTNVFGVKVTVDPSHGTVALNADGTFTYTADSTWSGSDSFTYCGNGATTGAACASVALGAETIESATGITCTGTSFNSSVATSLKISAPGVLTGCKDAAGYPLTVSLSSVTTPSNLHVSMDANGAFTATVPGGGTYSFTFAAQNVQGTVSSSTATVTLNFPQASNLKVTVLDGADKTTVINDYRWIIEEDRTFFVDPKCTQNPLPAGCPGASGGLVPNFGTNFHTSFMPVIASGCTGDVSCGSGQMVLGSPVNGQTPTMPGDVGLCDVANHPEITTCLDPRKRYYISVLPGDAAQPFIAGYAGAPDCSADGVAAGSCGHGMGGAPIPKGAHDNTQSIMILTQPSPYPPATLSVFVFEDDYPLNGEHDAGGGIDTLSPDEPGLGGFQVTLADDAGGTGDATGNPTYDMFNMPLSNSLIGTIDPVTQLDACPVSTQVTATSQGGDSTQNGITGMIVTCPKYESDGKTLSPLAGQALVKNLYQGRYGVIANPGADRLAAGEEWLQTNTLDGQKAHDSFMRIGEPGYFQEFGPAGYHVTIGFANPKIINDRGKALCPGTCPGEVKGHVTTARMSRTPDERLYGSGNHDAYAFTQCYVSIGDPDGADFGFNKCDADGNFDFKNVPPGNWKITTFDQWNDQVVDGITTPVAVCDSTVNGCNPVVDMKEVAVHQWQANIFTRTFIDVDGNGVSSDSEPGATFVDTNVRFRDGSFSNFNSTDLNGYAGFNEVFPLFNWYVIETDSTRYKNTGTHVVYDAGGPVDGSSPDGVSCSGSSTATKGCGQSSIADHLANTYEPNPLPADLSIPGAVYCSEGADCQSSSIATGPVPSSLTNHSTGRIDPPWVNSYGWQGFSGQNSFLEFGKKPFAEGENGGIHGHVVYASTRPFDDPQLLLQLSWEPLIPHVRVNLYKEGFAADGVTQTLTLVDYTETSSFDDWSQGFRSDGIPNMNCPGQGTDKTTMSDPYFWFALKDQPQWLDLYNNNGNVTHALPYDSQYKCYDGMHNWNQLQPAPYDGMYQFPSVTAMDPKTGKPLATNCIGCTTDPDTTDPYRSGMPMLPNGKYVVEVVVPQGYELVKEEDKNILIGDNYIAPVTQQFGGLGSIFILPDQAELAAGNASNVNNGTNNLGRDPNLPSHEGDTGNIETYWPCVGEERIVPDFISLFPGSQEVAPFAGSKRRLCDRKEVNLTEQSAGLAKFYLFTPTHTASHFTGVITDDFSAEFDPYSPQFGEKYAPAYLPVSFKDWAGNEITRVYSDAWGSYNGLNYSTWEVNPPNPTGYGPTMMVGCMNDAGPVLDPATNQMVTDPLFQSGYSQFCYELPFMPGQTGYFDTPVVPTSAFAGGYNSPDCAYPDATPAVSEVDGDGVGPWVAGLKGTVTTVTLTNGGSGYTGTPTVTFNNTGTGGTGVAATAVVNGTVTKVNVTNGGEYALTNPPTISFSNGGGSGAAANLTLSANNVFSVSITNGGTGYTTRPTVQFVGGGGSGAAGTATVNGARRVTGVTITSRGTGYTSAPTILFVNGGGSGAAGTVNLGNSVLSATVTNGGSGYTSAPTVSFSPSPNPGTRAAGNAVETGTVVAINITNNGSNYTGAPTVTLAGGGGTGAAATASVELNGTLTITSLGNQNVDNYAYSGPSASVAPYNLQKTQRHYGFGAQCITPTGDVACNTVSSVTIGGVTAPIVSWASDGSQIKVQVPAGVAACTLQQQTQYGGSNANCGQLVITAGNGKQSVDAVTVTIGGKAPTVMAAGQSIQSAIDAALPGDLIIVPKGTYSEMILMWKPVRLQGVAAASVNIDANPHPAGKLNPWRRQVVCLFGLSMNGVPITGTNPYDSNGTFTCSPNMQFAVDRAPLEATVGWDATLNGNLAEQLIEPTIMGAYEGAGITVLSKGVKFPAGSNPFASDVFPDGTLLLTSGDCGSNSVPNPYPSNFLCNPSRIDGLTIKNSSQGGGGILVHAWGHKLEISNNRVLNNQGTLSGGITVGQGEHPDAFLAGDTAATVPGSCVSATTPANLALPYCFDMDVNVHNNMVSQNSSLGDELFSSTPAGAGGVTFCNGSDYYKFNYNWVCGNMSTGDGAGVAHIGLSYDGDIEHNTILFNQSTNPTIVTNGGGLLIMGAPDADPPCGLTTDKDCVSAPGTITPSDGTGPGLIINANLILGNSADSGSGGGLRLQHINGNDVLNFPNGSARTNWPIIAGHAAQPAFQTVTPWNTIQVTNNVIANNVAGWDGGGVSLQDALSVNMVNNTIVSNDSTASSGVLFQTLFAPLASTQGTNCVNNTGNGSCPQVAGLVSVTNSAVLAANISQLPRGNAAVTCPAGHGTAGAGGSCIKYSVPELYNNMFWQNRTFSIGVGGLGGGFVNQQNVVKLYDPGYTSHTAYSPTPAADQNATGACNDTHASYWDIGVRGDKGPGDHTAGTLAPSYSVLTNNGALAETADGTNLLAGAQAVNAMYCNGSRTPVEAGGLGWELPPGTNESNALPAPPFTLLAGATVDEGNNWINLRWGPLALTLPNPSTGNSVFTFDPTPVSGINHIPSTATAQYGAAPTTDFYGHARKVGNSPVDVGAIELPPPAAPTLTSIAPATGLRGTTVAVTLTGTNLTGASAVNVSGTGFTVNSITVVNSTTVTANFVIASNATVGNRNVTVTTPGGTSGAVTFSVTAPAAPTVTGITPNTGARDKTVNVTITGTNLTGATVTVSGTTLLQPQVPVSNVVVVNSTTITATFTITSFADIASHTVTVTTGGGTATTNFTVTQAGTPTLASISPTSHARGGVILPQNFTVTLTGTNFVTGATVNVSGSGTGIVRLPAVVSADGTTITQNWSLFSGAGTGARTVTVTSGGVTTSGVTFTIN